ncbi:MAG: PrgI family protein [Parcubacteria group bacterium]|nr:PrgI family protein [Parcubacteria group bacterium]
MQYTVPKFIDQEDKIIGPITVRQFLLMIVGAIFIAIAYALLRFTAFIAVTVIIAVITGVIAFLKINGRPFHFFLASFIERTKKPAVRVWNKELTDAELRHYVKVKKEEVSAPAISRPRLSTSHLSQLSLVVDTGGSYAGEDVLEVLAKQPPSKNR